MKFVAIMITCILLALATSACINTETKTSDKTEFNTEEQTESKDSKPETETPKPPKPIQPKETKISYYDLGYEAGYSSGVEDGESGTKGLGLEEDLAGEGNPNYIKGFKVGYENGWNDYMGGAIEEEDGYDEGY